MIRIANAHIKGMQSEGPATYPSLAPEEKIDYVFVSRDIEVKSVKTIEKVISDHFPVVAEIEI